MFLSTKICKNCGKVFTPKRKHGLYCKVACRVGAHKIRHGLPVPDFSLLNNNNLPSREEIRKRELNGLMSEAAAKINQIERSMKTEQIDEQAYNLIMEKKRQHTEWMNAEPSKDRVWTREPPKVHDLDLIRAEERTLRASEKLKPKREEINQLLKSIQKYGKELESLEQEIYISKNKTANKLHTASSLSETTFETLGFTGEWKTLLGVPERGFTALIYGEKFCGKSTFALKLADYLTKFGKVIYFSVEEGVKMTMQNKLRALGITNSKLNISEEQLPEAIMKMAKKFDFAIIDSLTTANITADDLRNAKLANAKTAYIGVNHITVDGKAKGGTGQLHNPDIVIRIEPIGLPIIEKNRYHQDDIKTAD
jgi:hypothetical protein